MVQQIRHNNQRDGLTFITLFLACSLFLFSCASGKRYINVDDPLQTAPDDVPRFTIYALGDAGESNAQSKEVIRQLAGVASDDVQSGVILFLGDNIYPSGVPDESDSLGYRNAQAILKEQIEGLSSYTGQMIFIPGNHDWNEFKPGGLASIKRQDRMIQTLSPKAKMLPSNGCGGPEALQLTPELVMIIIDSQWWIQDWTSESDINKNCTCASREQFVEEFHNLIAQYNDQQIIVALHHPLLSRGPHGGYYSLRDHLFPLSKVVDWLYIPLPVVGSIYPWYRTVIGHPQDIKNKRYSSLRDALLHELNYTGDLIFLSGHEHNLQYLMQGKRHFLTSGSGSKQNAIANGKELLYGHKKGGFMQIDYFSGGDIFLTVYEIDPKEASLHKVFTRLIVDN